MHRGVRSMCEWMNTLFKRIFIGSRPIYFRLPLFFHKVLPRLVSLLGHTDAAEIRTAAVYALVHIAVRRNSEQIWRMLDALPHARAALGERQARAQCARAGAEARWGACASAPHHCRLSRQQRLHRPVKEMPYFQNNNNSIVWSGIFFLDIFTPTSLPTGILFFSCVNFLGKYTTNFYSLFN